MNTTNDVNNLACAPECSWSGLIDLLSEIMGTSTVFRLVLTGICERGDVDAIEEVVHKIGIPADDARSIVDALEHRERDGEKISPATKECMALVRCSHPSPKSATCC